MPFALLVCPSVGTTGCGDDEEVQVTVVSILATNKNNKVDKKLKDLAKRIEETRPDLKFTGYKIDRQNQETMIVGKAHEFEFVDKQKAAVTVRQGADADNKVRLKVKLQCGSEMCYKTCCGKFLPICTCHKTANGDCLLIAVMVEPCKGK
jgi:hypothetical protein